MLAAGQACCLAALSTLLIACVSDPAWCQTSLHFMDGTWQSPKLLVVLDMEPLLGNADSGRPFQRDFVRVRKIAGQDVEFDIGDRRFSGRFTERALFLRERGSAELTLVKKRLPESVTAGRPLVLRRSIDR